MIMLKSLRGVVDPGFGKPQDLGRVSEHGVANQT